jgi:hypothetical protein
MDYEILITVLTLLPIIIAIAVAIALILAYLVCREELINISNQAKAQKDLR